MEQTPTVFISYSWDDELHKKWVLDLANRLIEEGGVEVILDQYEMQAGKNLNHFMERAVAEADKVLLILTENYKLKAENRRGGVGGEYSMISVEWYKNQLGNNKFIPILRGQQRDKCVPVFVNAFLTIDMNDDQQMDAKFSELLHAVYNQPLIKKPKRGKRPIFSTPTESDTFEKTTSPTSQRLATERTKYADEKEVRALQKHCRDLLANNKIEQVLQALKNFTEKSGQDDLHNDLISFSSRWSAHKRKQMLGLQSFSESSVEQNQIVSGVLNVIGLIG